MGLYDRDYYRQPASASSVGRMGMWSVTTWLIVINVAVFILDQFLYRAGIARYIERLPNGVGLEFFPIAGLCYFSVATAIAKFEVWRVVTFQFLHGGLAHLLFNMIGLYFFGPMIESYLGSRRYLAFYLLCGIGGPVAYVALWVTHVLIASPWVPLVGASAGVFGILIAAARIAPNATVLIYGIIPMRLKTLAWVLLGIAVYTVLAYGSSNRGNAGGEAAHLGGAAVGALLIRNAHWLRFADFRLARRRKPPF